MGTLRPRNRVWWVRVRYRQKSGSDVNPEAKEWGVVGEGEVRVRGVVWVKVKGVVGEGEVKAKVRE